MPFCDKALFTYKVILRCAVLLGGVVMVVVMVMVMGPGTAYLKHANNYDCIIKHAL